METLSDAGDTLKKFMLYDLLFKLKLKIRCIHFAACFFRLPPLS